MSKRLILPTLGLVALALWLALRAAPPLRLDVGAPGAARFLWGFYDAELAAGGGAFRWSGPEARLLLHGAPTGPSLLALRLSGERLSAAGAPAVALARGATTYAAFDARPGWRVYRVLLPPGALAGPAGRALPLELRSAVSRPGAGEDSRDYRALGLPLGGLELAPLRGGPTGAAPRALWLAGLAGLAAAAAWALAPRAALPAAIGAGAALAALAWRAPHGLAWALPVAPWALGAALALGAGALAWRRRPGWARLSPAALLGAVALLAAGVALMHTQLAPAAGLAVAAAGLVALGAPAGGLGAGLWGAARGTERAAPHGGAASQPADVARRRALLLLAAIFALALGLRLLRIGELPFGLWRDEARHGLVALRIAEDPAYRPVYVGDRVDLPGLGLYPFAAALKLFGVHLWTLRLVTAVAGALTVLPLYVVAARLSGRRAVGLLAALLLACASWHISISRFAFPTVYEPLLSLTAWWLLLVALDGQAGPGPGRRLAAGLGAGALLGLAAQTYHIGRVTPLAAGWLVLLLALRAPGRWRPALPVAAAAALGFGLTVAPLAAYALGSAGEFNDRVGAVFLLAPDALKARAPLAALDESLGRHLLMFTAVGDANGRHHGPLRPLLDILSGAGLLLGLAALLRRAGDWRSRFLLGALGIGLVPGLLAVDAPHAMRTFGALGPACIIAALGLAELARLAREAGAAHRGRGASPLPAALAIFVAGLVGLNGWLYFGVMPRDPQVYGGFYPVQSWMGVYVGEHGGAARIFVPEGVVDSPSFTFLTAGRPVERFSVTDGGVTFSAPPAPGDRFLLSGYFAEDEAAALARALGGPPVPQGAGPPFPGSPRATYYVVAGP